METFVYYVGALTIAFCITWAFFAIIDFIEGGAKH